VSVEGPTPTSRREARERALELAYEAEIRNWTVDQLLQSLVLDAEPLTETLLRSAEDQKDKAESLIAGRAKGWTLARMPVIDRLVMRLAVAEMLTATTPTGVILSEAVDLATRYSTDESGRFVNGVLAAIARDLG
jgi:transcription antitermination protein NusB